MFECASLPFVAPDDVVSGLGGGEPSPGIKVSKRVATALRFTGDDELANLFESCRPSRPCRLLHCDRCRAGWFFAHHDRVKELKTLWYGDTEYGDHLAKLHMRHVTGLVALLPLNVRKIRGALTRDKEGFKSFRKTFKTVARCGFYEIELIPVGLMFESGACPEKRRTLSEMVGGDLSPSSGVMALLHWHFLFFFRGGDGQEDKVQSWLEKHYPAHRQCRMDRMRKDKNLSESFQKLSSYPLKNRHRYNLRFDTDGYKDGPYIGREELSFLVKLSKVIPFMKEMEISSHL